MTSNVRMSHFLRLTFSVTLAFMIAVSANVEEREISKEELLDRISDF